MRASSPNRGALGRPGNGTDRLGANSRRSVGSATEGRRVEIGI
nr:MAG TPA: hypothetical protein [Caudoviricetes sp.]